MVGRTLEEAKAEKKAIRDRKAGWAGNLTSNTSNGSSTKKVAFHTLKDANGQTCYAVDGKLLYPSALIQPHNSSTPPFTGHIAVDSPSLPNSTIHNLSLKTNDLSTLLTDGDQWELFTRMTITDDPRASVDWSNYHQDHVNANIAICTDVKQARC